MSRLLRCCSIALVLCLLVGSVYFWSRVPERPAVSEPQTIARHVRYGFELRNTAGTPLRDITFQAYAPLPRAPRQKLVELSASHAFDSLDDPNGNRLLQFRIDRLPPYGTKIITVSAVVEMQAPDPQSQAPDPIYLQPERLIQSDHLRIRKVAGQFTGQPASRARRIQDWVHRQVADSGYARQDRGALYALTHKSGDCTEFATLFTALCRASGIPARVLGGYVCNGDQVLRPQGYHNWAEYHDGQAWRIADPQNNLIDQDGAAYVALQILQFDRKPRFFHRFWCDTPQVMVRMKT